MSREKSQLGVLRPFQPLPGSTAVWRHLVVVVFLPNDLCRWVSGARQGFQDCLPDSMCPFNQPVLGRVGQQDTGLGTPIIYLLIV